MPSAAQRRKKAKEKAATATAAVDARNRQVPGCVPSASSTQPSSSAQNAVTQSSLPTIAGGQTPPGSHPTVPSLPPYSLPLRPAVAATTPQSTGQSTPAISAPPLSLSSTFPAQTIPDMAPSSDTNELPARQRPNLADAKVPHKSASTVEDLVQQEQKTQQFLDPAAGHASSGVQAVTRENFCYGKAPLSTSANEQQPYTAVEVKKVDTETALKGLPFPQETLSDDFPRPALLANHFHIKPGKYDELFKYDLTFLRKETDKDRKARLILETKGNAPLPATVNGISCLEIDPARPKRRRLIWLLMHEFIGGNQETCFATDYFEEIICTAKIPADANPWHEEIIYRDEYESQPAQDADVFFVKIHGPKVMSLTDLFKYLSSQGSVIYSDKQHMIKALNTIFSYGPYQKCFQQSNQPRVATETNVHPKLTTRNGTKFHGVATGQPPTDTETGMAKRSFASKGSVTIPGFARSVRVNVSQPGLLTLNVNTGTSIFYAHARTLQDLINTFRQGSASQLLVSYDKIRELNGFLKNINVRTTYLGAGVDFIGRVTGLPPNPAPANCTMVAPGTTGTMTVQTHFQLPVHSSVIVVILGEGRNRRTVPANLLRVIPGQLNRNTNEKPRQGIRAPAENRDLLIHYARNLFLDPARPDAGGAKQFDLNLGENLLRVPLEHLRIPNIQYRASRYQSPMVFNCGHGGGRGRGVGRGRGHGRQLGVNQVVTAQNDNEFAETLRLGSWNLSQRSYVLPADGFRWTYIDLRLGQKKCSEDNLEVFRNLFPEVMREVGITNARFVDFDQDLEPGRDTRHHLDLPYDPLPGYDNQKALDCQDKRIENLLTYLKEQSNVDVVFLFLPGSNQDLYGAIKRIGDQKVGITTICHVATAWDREEKQMKPQVKTTKDFFANLTMKLNLKVKQNTANHALLQSGPILDAQTMILGIDVTHPGGSAMKNAPSVAAVVGSVDKAFAQWPASLAYQMPGSKPGHNPNNKQQAVEQVTKLEIMVKERLLAFYHSNQSIPRQIIVYRDGLSEEQFGMCQTYEYPKIHQGIELARDELGEMAKTDLKIAEGVDTVLTTHPKILLICAVKRHHTRCYPELNQGENNALFIGRSSQGYNFNPVPGTMITQRITYGTGRDFFLYSQNAIQGTARPTHYNILVDEIGCTADDVAQMTHNLSYLFGRATRSTGVCAPVYYADLAADRARHYVRRIYHHFVPHGQPRATFAEGTTPINLQVHANLRDQMYYI